jgi:hypothetical protein
MKNIAILGSGSSALAAAMKLIEHQNDFKITLIDFAASESAQTVSVASGSAIKTSAKKYLFSLPSVFATFSETDVVLGSSAFGGWAEAWGGTIVPLSEEEMNENGLTIDEFSSNEKAIRILLKGRNPDFRLSENRVVSGVFRRKLFLELGPEHKVELSDLAIRGLSNDITQGCNQCGMCLLGCPGEHIFKPSSNWNFVKKSLNIEEIKQVWVNTIRENELGVEVSLTDLSRKSTSLNFDYVFCGLGAIQTAALMTRSKVSDLVSIQDSQLVVTPFVDPLLRKTGTKRSRIGLSELFIFSQAPIARFKIFSQLYGASDALTKMIYDSTPILRFIPKWLAGVFLSRIGIAMQFLDSASSGVLQVSSINGKTEVKRVNNPTSRAYLKFFAALKLLKFSFIPLFFISKFYKVGDGYHFGGSFPFDRSSMANTSDFFGRPNGMSKISLIDSSILTSKNAKPNTFNTMVKARVIVTRVINSNLIGTS